ncbi:4'-phosphopantetheinyl transferase family protein [Xenorhabdus cabanillasii]|uniref:Enterobactin synthase component D n=3 Tax=Xenorhabdus cabanillasii TaxID=351673 RepID=A0A3D9URQ0_9GAMM|nr:4'-phosphopantetheinyl transferase superfamily protein [Xenorhabdus cabanillasii]PHM75526.1 putative non-ribosomal peptide synthetase [Xenorhabdus cabanillasii JM26]REF27351.1 4'-phosphopantetheinyl transferase EntD [Xenorhabdus cabanillasii]CDL79645.1 4'-phosphopantetheinyl tranferase, involved in ability of P. luminescens to support nematode growth and reproduction [Xenorhabdus cabanillasii JM26]
MKEITFTPVQTTAINEPFFTDIQRGQLSDHPEIQVMLTYFAPNFYQDNLFDKYGVTYPTRLHNAVTKRRAEYLAARYCTRRILKAMGYPEFQVETAKDRSPVWPEKIYGSISHSTNCAIVFAASGDKYQLIGIDIEKEIKQDTIDSVSASIINEAEAELLSKCPLSFIQAFTLVFSIKESLFKALYPHVKRFFDFHAAEIMEIDCIHRTITIKLLQTLSDEYQAGCQFHGNFVLMPQQQILTYIVG